MTTKIDCKSAMQQGYADLAHKMHCDPLPNTGRDLLPVLVLVGLFLIAGIVLVFASRRARP